MIRPLAPLHGKLVSMLELLSLLTPGCQLRLEPGECGVISLFDGVSSVVRVLTKKLGCSPTAICLAELDIELMKSWALQR